MVILTLLWSFELTEAAAVTGRKSKPDGSTDMTQQISALTFPKHCQDISKSNVHSRE